MTSNTFFADITKQVQAHLDRPVQYPAHIISYCKGLSTGSLFGPEDLQRLARSRGVDLAPEEAKDLFAIMDTDYDGSVQQEELIAWLGNDEWSIYSLNPKGSILKSQMRHEAMQALLAMPFPFPAAEPSRHPTHEASLRSENAPAPGTGGTRITANVVPFTAAALKSEVLIREGEIIADGDDEEGEDDDESEEESGEDEVKGRDAEESSESKVNTFFTTTFPMKSLPTDKDLGQLKKTLRMLCKTVFRRPISRGHCVVTLIVEKTGPHPSLTLSVRSKSMDPILKDFFKMLCEVFDDSRGDLFNSPENFLQNATFDLEFEKDLGSEFANDSGALASVLEKYFAMAKVTGRTGFLKRVSRVLFTAFAVSEQGSSMSDALQMLLMSTAFSVLKNQRVDFHGVDPSTALFEVIAAVADSARDIHRVELRQNGDVSEWRQSAPPLHTEALEQGIRFYLERFFPVHVTPTLIKKFFYKLMGSQRELKALPQLAHFASKHLGMASQVQLSTAFYRTTVEIVGLDVFSALPKSDADMSALWAKYVGGKWANPFAKKKKGSDDEDGSDGERNESGSEAGSENREGGGDMRAQIVEKYIDTVFNEGVYTRRYPHVKPVPKAGDIQWFQAYSRVVVVGSVETVPLNRQVYRGLIGTTLDTSGIEWNAEYETKPTWAWVSKSRVRLPRPYFVIEATCDVPAVVRDLLIDADVLVVVVDGSAEPSSELQQYLKTEVNLVGIPDEEENEEAKKYFRVNPRLQCLVVAANNGKGGAQGSSFSAIGSALYPLPVSYTEVDVTDRGTFAAALARIVSLPCREVTRSSVWDTRSHAV